MVQLAGQWSLTYSAWSEAPVSQTLLGTAATLMQHHDFFQTLRQRLENKRKVK